MYKLRKWLLMPVVALLGLAIPKLINIEINFSRHGGADKATEAAKPDVPKPATTVAEVTPNTPNPATTNRTVTTPTTSVLHTPNERASGATTAPVTVTEHKPISPAPTVAPLIPAQESPAMDDPEVRHRLQKQFIASRPN